LVQDIDSKILKYICRGVYSYGELGELCGVARSTIYRRIDKLEKDGLIKRRIMALPNFEKLGLSAVIIGMDAHLTELDKIVHFLKSQNQIKLLWKTYGTHDIVFTILCNKNDVGKSIQELKKALAKLDIMPQKIDVSVSLSWEKMHLTP